MPRGQARVLARGPGTRGLPGDEGKPGRVVAVDRRDVEALGANGWRVLFLVGIGGARLGPSAENLNSTQQLIKPGTRPGSLSHAEKLIARDFGCSSSWSRLVQAQVQTSPVSFTSDIDH